MEFRKVIRGCIVNDRRAQAILFNEYIDILGNVAYRYASSQEVAQDILQDSFIKIFLSIDRQFEDQNHFESWMKRIVINTAINQLRAEQTYKEVLGLGVANDPIKEMPLEFSNESLLIEIRQLSLNHQQIINLIVVDGLSHKEAADILGIMESSSRSRYTRAIQVLRCRLTSKQEIKQR